jgi:FAD/FMN-containing dehydrogenase
MEPFAVQKLSGWGRFPVEECRLFRPEKRRLLAPLLASGQERSFIPRGLGRSYGDAALNGGGGVLDYTRFNRMLAFDPETGVLECEAGVSLAEILEVFVPRGFFPPVIPGTKFITVGGAIANDIHAKNHHRDGTFGQFVESLQLLTAAGEVLTCSPETNRDVFWATVGGIGLTGLILSARVRLRRIESAYVVVDYRRTRDLEETLAAMTESDEQYQYSVAWIDCLASGASLGRSVLMRGNHATRDALPRSKRDPFRVKRSFRKTVPFDFPSRALNPVTVKAFNAAYYKLHPTAPGKLERYDGYFCPLDSIDHWNRMYGRRGFAQYQPLFPSTGVAGLQRVIEILGRSGHASFLAVLKRMGPGNAGLLSYPYEGYTLALDIPMRKDLVPFLHALDQVVIEHGGRLYCAKDATALPETFAAMYPRLDEFRSIKARLDPNTVFASSMARRLGIVDPSRGG